LEVAPSYNIAPTTMQPVIRNNRDTGEREMVVMRWDMVPHFTKSLADFKGFSTINAKAETLLSKQLQREGVGLLGLLIQPLPFVKPSAG